MLSLEDYQDQAWNCCRCGMCKFVIPWKLRSERFLEICPSGAKYKFAAYYSQGKMDMARALVEGEMDYTESIADILYHCTLCGACEVNCLRFQGKEPASINEALRAELVERGMVVPEHQAYLESTLKHNNPFDCREGYGRP